MKNNRKAKGRLSFVLFLFVFCLSGLFGRVYYLKTVKGNEYEQMAKTQQVTRYGDTTISPNRGAIVDRNMQTMAVSTTVYNVILDCRVVAMSLEAEDQEKTLTALCEAFPEQLDYQTLKGYVTINPDTQRPIEDTNWKVLVKLVERETIDALKEQKLKGVVYQKDTKREYPLKTVACQVIGFIRGDAKLGLEKQYNLEMTGIPGRSFVTYDGSHNANTQEVAAQDGSTIVTTIDFTMQQYAEEAIDQAIQEYDVENASVLIMNPNTGEVYAMADSRRFDNNAPSKPVALSDPAFATQWEAMSEEEQYDYLNKTWNNFNISSTFEPGSIFKPMVMAAALEENAISLNDTYFCGGRKTVADRSIACWYHVGHGEVTLEDILAESCNVGMMEIGAKMGSHLLYQYQKDFGFGETTGIDLPAEFGASSLMYSEEEIGPVELATMSFGQSFNCTPIQVMDAFCAVINGGKLMRPYVVSQVIDVKGNIVKETKPQVVRQVISQQTSDTIRKYLQSTVEYGTGKKGKIAGYNIGGKTGTAEQGDRKKEEYVVSFIAFFPMENPQYAVMTVLNRPKPYVDGVTSSVPMTKNIIEKIIRYKNLEPDYETDGQSPSQKKADLITVDDFTGKQLDDIIDNLLYLGLQYEVVGTGNTIVNQAPHGGTEVEEGSQIILYVERGEGDSGNKIVPDVKGMGFEEATTALVDAGLTIVVEGDEENGVAIGQKPNSGVTVEDGCEITVKFQKPAKTSEE